MRLTRYTDYALRVLLYLGARPDEQCSIREISSGYGISQNHLMKVVNDLARAGYVASVRGRSGGIRLGRAPQDINIGVAVRELECDFDLVECGACVIAPVCGLTGVLADAVRAFFSVLDRYTLADLLSNRDQLADIFRLRSAAPA
jgi:Rrf2 family nitric oxide-sensitive transcriptional repressor